MTTDTPDHAASLGARLGISLVFNVGRAVLAMSTGLLVARWMGPTDYGRYAYLVASFLAFRQVIDLASSTAFFTFIAQRPRTRAFVNRYGFWVAGQLCVAFVLVAVVLPGWVSRVVWPGEPRWIIVLALVAAFAQHHLWPIASQMAEASRRTARVQLVAVIVLVAQVTAAVVLHLTGVLTVGAFLCVVAVEWVLASYAAARLYVPSDAPHEPDATDSPGAQLAAFWVYCRPLVPYAGIAFGYEFADRWMLQHWGGAVQQGYFATAQQFSAIALLATTAVLNAFWKEIAEAHELGQTSRAEGLHRRLSHGLFFLSASAACAILPWTGVIVPLMLGPEYSVGADTFAVMLLYPLHQSLGQIAGVLCFATGNTRGYAAINSGMLVISVAATSVLLAPSDVMFGGAGLGSLGLALKLVGLQVIQVNLLGWWLSRRLQWAFRWQHQVVSLLLALGLAFGARAVSGLVMAGSPIPWMVTSTVMYLSAMAVVVWRRPSLAGLSEGDVARAVALVSARFFR